MTSAAESIMHEYHRRLTHFEKREPAYTPLARAQVAGELIGLRGALGIALGGSVRGGDADGLAVQEHGRWRVSSEAEGATCACDGCKEERTA